MTFGGSGRSHRLNGPPGIARDSQKVSVAIVKMITMESKSLFNTYRTMGFNRLSVSLLERPDEVNLLLAVGNELPAVLTHNDHLFQGRSKPLSYPEIWL